MRTTARNLRTLANRTNQYGVQPDPPRGLRFKDGVLSWERPRSTRGLTHFNIYADKESNLVRRLPAGQLQLNDHLTADRVFVSSFNVYGEKESNLVALLEPVAPLAPNVGTGGDSGWTDMVQDVTTNEVEPDMANGSAHSVELNGTPTIILGPVNGGGPLIAGRILRIRIVQPAAGGKLITWTTTVYKGTDEREHGMDANMVSWYTFIVRPDNKLELCDEVVKFVP